MEAYRRTLASIRVSNPQMLSDVEDFLNATNVPVGLFTRRYGNNAPDSIPTRLMSRSWSDLVRLLQYGDGADERGFIRMNMRGYYAELMRDAKRQLLEYIRRSPQQQQLPNVPMPMPVTQEEMFPGPIPLNQQDYGNGRVRQPELVRGLGCCAECDERGGSTKREQFLKTYKVPDKSYSIEELSAISKVPVKTLQEVYNRGIGAYKTNPKSVRLKGSFVKGVNAPMSAKLSKEQWAMSRVYSFLTGNPKHDEDLRVGTLMSDIATSAKKMASLKSW